VAKTPEAALGVDAGGAVGARVLRALVHVNVTEGAGVAPALAHGARDALLAPTPVLARVRVAEPPVVAALARQPRGAPTLEVVALVGARAAVEARVVGARVAVHLALPSEKPVKE
jgi:hypothetical protein